VEEEARVSATIHAERDSAEAEADRPTTRLSAVPQLGCAVLVVDSCQLIQAGLRTLLLAEPWVGSYFTASDVATTIHIVRRSRPHVVLADTLVPGVSGFELARMIRSASPTTRVALMSASCSVSASQARASQSVAAFLPKGLPARSFVTAVERVVRGESVFARLEDTEPTSSLSRRETDVLRHMMTGLSNREIGVALHLSRHTVKQHTSSIYRKLHVRNRAEAITRACELGLVF
jgi:DNA-binding NarL/FixJ family response regulator